MIITILKDDVIGLAFPENGCDPWITAASVGLSARRGNTVTFTLNQGGIRDCTVFSNRKHKINFRKNVMKPLSWLYPELDSFTGKAELLFDPQEGDLYKIVFTNGGTLTTIPKR